MFGTKTDLFCVRFDVLNFCMGSVIKIFDSKICRDCWFRCDEFGDFNWLLKQSVRINE